MANDQVSVEISIEERAALKALTKLIKGIEDFEKQSVESVKKSDRAFDSFKGNLAAIATSGAIRDIKNGLRDLVVGSLDAAAATEKIQTQLEVLTGSQEKAASLFQELTDFSATTPFQLQGIAEASAQLLSFGFEAETVQGRIARIGEVAAGSGSDLKEVALIYGQVAAAGKLTGERLLQLQERAIPIGSALANSLGVAESEVRELVSSGVVGFKEFEEAFNSLSESGGLFEGAISKQSQTINGALSTLNDNIFILQSEPGKAFAPAFVDGAKQVTSALQDLTKVIIDNKSALEGAIGFVADYIDVYTGLAASALESETPLSRVNEKIEESAEKLSELAQRKAELEDNKGSFFGLFDANTELQIQKINALMGEQEAKLKNLVNERKNIVGLQREEKAAAESTDTGGTDDNRAKQEEEVNQKIVSQRRQLFLQLEQLRVEERQKEAERKLAQDQLSLEEREVELQKIQQYEQQKATLVLAADQEKNAKLRDAESQRLANEAANAKASVAIKQSQLNAEKAITDARLANEQRLIQGYAVALNQAANLAKKGTAEQKALAIASSTINTYQAATRAYRDYPFPANIAVMATTIAAGLNQVSQIQKQSFQTGGVVGGFSGATNGMDNTTANVRTGEMVLNGNQQRRLFDIADGRASNDNSDLVNAVNNLASQPVVVEIEGREVARAVRDQRLEGFAV